MSASGQPSPALVVITGTSSADARSSRFQRGFRIGRGPDCEVNIQDQYVSRYHVSVTLENGQWWVRDLRSSNGIFVEGQRVDALPIQQKLTIQLGIRGQFVSFEVELPDAHPADLTQRYFGELKGDEVLGERTLMIRRAYQEVTTKQKWKYWKMLGGLAALVVMVGAFALYQHRQLSRQEAIAKDLFYAMKSMDVDIASVQLLVQDANSGRGMAQIRNLQAKRKEMAANYNRFLSTLHVYDSKMSEQDRLILRVARIFGECELTVPSEFIAEVKTYIGKWQSTGRLQKGITRARENGYTGRIVQDLLAQDLPPQFFYLALQESGFDPFICGPPTHKGIAKGMWQFIPETALAYGLRLGPLVDFRRPDPADDRQNWEKETVAASRYIKFIYSTDAQASGLLVMASYNWGERSVVPLIQSMPPNPRDRNFWQLITKHRNQLPQETYDYVFYIFSAAVIGENPRLFGLHFDNPLDVAERK